MKNIVKEGAWTTLPTGSQLRNEAPRVRVTPYKIKSTQLAQSIKGFISATKLDTKAFYEGLYNGEEKGHYYFPYFGNDFRSFTTDFADTLSNITDRGSVSIGETVNKIGGELAGAGAQVSDFMKNIKAVGDGGGGPSVGTYIETPKFYQFANTDAPLNVSFPLLNTVNEGDAQKNQAFIKEFTKLNRPERKDSITMDFPHIYKVRLKGLRFIRWAYCDNLTFSMVGQRRIVGGDMVPEAYICNMSFRSLTVEVANFMDETK